MFKEVGGTVFYVRDLGGPGSGNFGHAGRVGERGGSAAGGEASTNENINTPVNILSDPDAHKNIQFTPKEDSALLTYKGSGYASVNKSLILGSESTNDARVPDIIKGLDSALEKTTITGGTFHSGLGESGAIAFSKMNIGDEFIYKGYLSTSTDPYQSGSFMGRTIISGESTKSKIVLYAKYGTHAYSYGSEDNEHEVLFQRNQKLRLIDIKEEVHTTGDLIGTPGYKLREYHVEVLNE